MAIIKRNLDVPVYLINKIETNETNIVSNKNDILSNKQSLDSTLLKSNNLSDVNSVVLARQNLDTLSSVEIATAISNAQLGISKFYQIDNQTDLPNILNQLNDGDRLFINDFNGDGWVLLIKLTDINGNSQLTTLVSEVTAANEFNATNIKTLYESNPNTNAFTDGHLSSLNSLINEIVGKADKTDLNSIENEISDLQSNLDIKANKNDVYTKTQIDNNHYKKTDLYAKSSLYTKSEIDNLITNSTTDLTDYATKVYVDDKIDAINIPDVSNFVTENILDNKIQSLDIPDISNLASENYVDAKISNIAIDVKEAPDDGKQYIRKDKSWIELENDPAPDDGNYYKNGNNWVRQNDYDLLTTNITESTTVDIINRGFWNIILSGSNISVNVPNYLQNRSKVLVFVVKNNTSILTFTGRINWGLEGPPSLGSGFTVINMVWDPTGTQWLAACGSKGINL